MVHIQGATLIARRPEEVFDFVADERNEPSYNPRMVSAAKVTAGPVGRGTWWVATMGSPQRPFDMTIEVTEYDRPSRLGSTSRMSAAEVRGALTFEPDPVGTRMSWSWDLVPHGKWRLLSPVIARLGRRQEEEIWGAMKRRLENSGRAVADVPEPAGARRPARLLSGLVARLKDAGSTPAGTWVIKHVISPAQRLVYRVTRGRVSLAGRFPVLLMTTTGRRTGRARTVPLLYLREGDRYVICNVRPPREQANPWVLNVLSDPYVQLEVAGQTLWGRARRATELELTEYWPDLVELWPAYEAFHSAGGARAVFVVETGSGGLRSDSE